MVSIIVPVYNVDNYLERCIQSLIYQSIEREIILVDDGSTDNSAQICDSYAKKYSNIQAVHIRNAGVSNARNIGLSLAKGEYITFVDGDDWLALNFLEIGIKALENARADVFMSSYIISYDNGSEIKVNEDTDTMLLDSTECMKKIFVKSQNKPDFSWAVWGKIFKASLWENIRFNTNFVVGEDAIAFWEILKNADRFLYMPLMGYYYFQRINSVMHTYSEQNILDNVKMYRYFYDDSEKNCDKSIHIYFKHRYYFRIIEWILVIPLYEDKNVKLPLHANLILYINRYFQSAWYFYGIHGILKVLLACMPKFIIRETLGVCNTIRNVSHRVRAGFRLKLFASS